MTPAEAALVLGVSSGDVYQAIESGQLKARRTKRSYSILDDEVERYARERGIAWPGDEDPESLIEGADLIRLVLDNIGCALPYGVPLQTWATPKSERLPESSRRLARGATAHQTEWLYHGLRVLCEEGKLFPEYWAVPEALSPKLIGSYGLYAANVPEAHAALEIQRIRIIWTHKWLPLMKKGELIRAPQALEREKWEPQWRERSDESDDGDTRLQLQLDMLPIYDLDSRFIVEGEVLADVYACSPFGLNTHRSIGLGFTKARERWAIEKTQAEYLGLTRKARLERVNTLQRRYKTAKEIVDVMSDEGEWVDPVLDILQELGSKGAEASVRAVQSEYPEAPRELILRIRRFAAEGRKRDEIEKMCGKVDERVLYADVAFVSSGQYDRFAD